MWTAILSVLKFCLRYWKNIAVWLGISAIATWGVLEAFEGLKSCASWAFGHWADCFEQTLRMMEICADEFASISSSFDGWIGGLVSYFEISYFVELLIGWAGFSMVVLEWTLGGMFLSILGFVAVLVYFKMKMKGIEILKK